MAAVTDPVCGMQIESSQAEAQSQYQGQTYYFCSDECRQKFDADPKRYVKQS
jgi:Cu+-exporting ATPase